MRRALPAAALVLLAVASIAAQKLARVERVIDGDTVVIADLGTVRLIGVNTPETVDPRRPVQAFGREASAFLKALLADQVVRVEFDQAGSPTDRYGRQLAYLYLADGMLVNLEIVREGFGSAYTEFPFRLMDQFRAAEREARLAGRGLWADAAPAVEDATLVFIAKASDRYHRDTCRFVSGEREALRLDETPGHYTACAVCRPPLLK